MENTEDVVVFGKFKLTIFLLMLMPAGWWVVSDALIDGVNAVFAEKVVPASKRSAQWQRIVEADVQEKHCYIFRTTDDYDSFRESFLGTQKRHLNA